MIRNRKYIDRLYLAQNDDDTIYIDNDQIPQQTIEGIRFLYRQFKKRKNGVILNDPHTFGRNIQICLFVKAVRPLIHRPILILCQEGSEKEWVDRLDTWTNESLVKETVIETVKPFNDKMVMINTMVNLHLFCAREWSIIIVDGDQVTTPNPILKLPFKACFKIWNTSIDVKKNLDRFEEVYKWLYPRAHFDKKSFMVDSKNGGDVIEKAILIDTLCEDIVLRRDDGTSFENFYRACEKGPKKCATTITVVSPTIAPPSRMVGQTSIHPVRRTPVPTTTVAPTNGDSIFLQNTRTYRDTTITAMRIAPTNLAPTTVAPTNGDSFILENTWRFGDTTITPTIVTPSTSFVNPSSSFVTPSSGFVNPSSGFVNPSTNSVTPSTSTITPSSSSVNPSSSFVTPSSSFVTPSSSSVNPSTNSVTPSTSTVTPSTSSVTPPTSSITPSTSSVPPSTSSVPPSTSSVPTLPITKKNKDATGTKIKRSKVRIIESDTDSKSFPPSVLLSKLLAESPKPRNVGSFSRTIDYSLQNFATENKGQQSTESSKTKTDKVNKQSDAVTQTLENNLEEFDVMVMNHDLVLSQFPATDISAKEYHVCSYRKEIEPHTILTCIPADELNTCHKLFTDNKRSIGTMTTESFLGCSYNTERDEKNDREMLKIKSELSTFKPEVGITKVILDELNWEMEHLGTTDKTEQLGKRQKTTHSSETTTCYNDIIEKFNEQNKYTNVSCTKVKTEQVSNSLKRRNVDVLMKECTETVAKKYKGSFLDSLF